MHQCADPQDQATEIDRVREVAVAMGERVEIGQVIHVYK
jgi:hypothetical protein